DHGHVHGARGAEAVDVGDGHDEPVGARRGERDGGAFRGVGAVDGEGRLCPGRAAGQRPGVGQVGLVLLLVGPEDAELRARAGDGRRARGGGWPPVAERVTTLKPGWEVKLSMTLLLASSTCTVSAVVPGL